jgi:hypothetical protein
MPRSRLSRRWTRRSAGTFSRADWRGSRPREIRCCRRRWRASTAQAGAEGAADHTGGRRLSPGQCAPARGIPAVRQPAPRAYAHPLRASTLCRIKRYLALVEFERTPVTRPTARYVSRPIARIGCCESRARCKRRFPVGASPNRYPLQPEATGAGVEVTKCRKPLHSGRDLVTVRVCRPQRE